MLDAHSDRLASGSVDQDFQGFLALVHDRGTYPLVGVTGFQIRPGSHNLISLSATQVVSDERIRGLSPETRGCRFEDELDGMSLHKKYSQSNCLLECALNSTRDRFFIDSGNVTTCMPWFLPTASKTFDGYCDPWEAEKFVKLAEKHSVGCQKCLPGCIKTTYHALITTLPFRRCDDSNFETSSLCTVVTIFISRLELLKSLIADFL